MRTFAVDYNNDLVIGGDGNLAIATGQAAALFVCEHFARAARGEMIHRMHQGMPFFETAFGEGSNLAQYEAAFRKRMGQIPQVIAVREFNAEIVDGVLRYDAVIETQFGDTRMTNG